MIRAKLVLRNVIGKPLRSLIIILSLAAAAFAALFCIAGIHSAKNDLRDFFSANYGDMDMMIMSGNVRITQDDLPPGSKLLTEVDGYISETIPNSRYVNYVNQIQITVIGIDTQAAYEANMLASPYPTENGITMTETLAAQLGKKTGDIFSFYGDGNVKYDLEILSIAPPTRYLSVRQSSVLVTPELCNKIVGNKEGTVTLAYADVPENQVAGVIDMIFKEYPDHICMGTTSVDSDDTMNSMLNIYYLIFAVVFLMICFIVVSMSKHIVNERMSVIGMLRSVGGSIAGTGALLMCESAFYGLCGGVLGTLLYMPFKGSTLSFFQPQNIGDMKSHSDGINFLTITLVILSVVLIQCLFSAAAIVKAAKVPVRDIIFGTKDTVYLPSKSLTAAGAVMLAAGILLHFIMSDFIFAVFAAFLTMIGAVLIFPQIIFRVSKALCFLFTKLNMPVAKLAAKEISSTKSSISSAQLLLSALSLTISMFVIAVSLLSVIASPNYTSDIIITASEQDGGTYDYIAGNIDGVTDVEKLYIKSMMGDSKAKVNDTERDLMVIALNDGGYRYFRGIQQSPESLADDEIAVDKVLASKMDIHVGDTLSLGLKIESYLPTELKFRVKSLIDAGKFNHYGNTVMINLTAYKKIYFDNPSMVLVKTSPGMAAKVLDTMLSTLPDSPDHIMTMEDYIVRQKTSMDSILNILYAVMALGIVLSVMGTFSNMLMGFEHSRRKYAVYYSSSMSKDKLKKLIVWETILTSGVSAAASVIFGRFFLVIIQKALSLLNMSVPLESPLLYALIFGTVTFVLLLPVVIKPVRMLSKMNIAEEIKTGAD